MNDLIKHIETMWKFLFGKPKKEAAVVVDNYEDLLSKAMHQRQLREQSTKLVIQNESLMIDYLKASGWEYWNGGRFCPTVLGLHWQNSDSYPYIKIINEGDTWRVTYDDSTYIGTLNLSDDVNTPITKLEAILAAYKRLTSI
mgnify:CR=1 FL=1